ncbi:RNA polymerase sigma factor [Chitinophaga caeni]|uniref:RNA polymerase sigma factor n=1 Tax=Chitinophaga caeni TaxID=2029983 RepID=UPI0012FE5A18|nr:sigma-70 family RNA polymerase sigma factor [Chitinophaga caeni]
MPSPGTYQENELLVKVASGDKYALAEVYKLTYTRLYFIAKRLVDEDTAKDIVSESYVKLLHQPRSFESLAHIANYLAIMTRNACIDWLKSEKKEQLEQEAFNYITGDGLELGAHEQDDIRAALYKMVLDEIEKLPKLARTVFKLSYIEGKSNADISEILNIKDKTVRNKKAEALRALRLSLGPACTLIGILKIFPGI